MSNVLLSIAVSVLAPLCPHPQDKDGWGLRIGPLSKRGPFLQCEPIGQVWADVFLLNYSKEDREHDHLMVARDAGALRLTITGPDGKPLPWDSAPSGPRDPSTTMYKLRPGECFSERFAVGMFGYYHFLYAAGRYRIVASLWIGGKTVTSPSVEFEVVKVPDEAVLVSRSVPLEGAALKRPVDQRHEAAIQQIQIGNRIWLVYRRLGAKGFVVFANRLVELPGKVEMKVEGTYGEWGPIRITYKTSPTAEPTKIAIHSVDGLPWKEEDEQTWQERLKKKNMPPPRRGR